MLKNILVLMSGNIGAQAVALLVAPLIARIYAPDEFGTMTAVWAAVSLFGIAACAMYERTVLIEKEARIASVLATACLIIAVAIACSAACVVYLFDRFAIPGYFGVANVGIYVLLGVFAFGAKKTLEFLATRDKRFRLIALSAFAGAVMAAAWKIAAGQALEPTSGVLLAGNIIGLLLPVVLLLPRLYKKLALPVGAFFGAGLSHLREYSDFPRRQLPNGLINAVHEQAPVFVLAWFFSPDVVGYYGMAAAVLLRPALALGDSVSSVYLQRLAGRDAGDVRKGLYRLTMILAGIAAPFCIVMLFYGGRIFEFVFGSRWVDAGGMAALMTPWVFAIVFKAPATQVLLVKRELRYILRFNVTYLVARVSSLVAILAATGDILRAILVFSLIGLVANIFYVRKALSVAAGDASGPA